MCISMRFFVLPPVPSDFWSNARPWNCAKKVNRFLFLSLSSRGDMATMSRTIALSKPCTVTRTSGAPSPAVIRSVKTMSGTAVTMSASVEGLRRRTRKISTRQLIFFQFEWLFKVAAGLWLVLVISCKRMRGELLPTCGVTIGSVAYFAKSGC